MAIKPMRTLFFELLDESERKGLFYGVIANRQLVQLFTWLGPRLREHRDTPSFDDVREHLWHYGDNESINRIYGFENQNPLEDFVRGVENYEILFQAAVSHAYDSRWDCAMTPTTFAQFLLDAGAGQSSQVRDALALQRVRSSIENKDPGYLALVEAAQKRAQRQAEHRQKRLKEAIPWVLSEIISRMSVVPEQLVSGFTPGNVQPPELKSLETVLDNMTADDDNTSAIMSKYLDRLMSDHRWMESSPDFSGLAYLSYTDITLIGVKHGIDPIKAEHVATINRMRELSESDKPEFDDEIPF